MELSLTKLLLLALVVLIIFGTGKLPQAMKDLGKGIRNFKDGMNDNDEVASNKKQTKSKPVAIEGKTQKEIEEDIEA